MKKPPRSRRHGPATLAAFQGHIERMRHDAAPLELPDCTAAGINRRQREAGMTAAQLALFWFLTLFTLLAIAGLTFGGGGK